MSPSLSWTFHVETLSELKTFSRQRTKQKTWSFHSEYTRVFRSGGGNTVSNLFSSDLRIKKTKKNKTLEDADVGIQERRSGRILQDRTLHRREHQKKTLTNFA